MTRVGALVNLSHFHSGGSGASPLPELFFIPKEPAFKNAIAFFDGQNLYGSAKTAFGYTFPNYDVSKLAEAVCSAKGWSLVKTCFYTGIPDASDNQRWHDFWSKKLAVMGTRGVQIYTRKLKYRNQTFRTPDGTEHTILVGQEKGVDIRIALDVVNATVTGACDVAVVFSQDQDLSEVADEVRRIATVRHPDLRGKQMTSLDGKGNENRYLDREPRFRWLCRCTAAGWNLDIFSGDAEGI